MQYRNLGKSGLKVSALSLGTITFGAMAAEDAAFAIMDAYVEGGGNFIDTANAYARGASEEIIGRWMKARGNRDRIVLATKAGIRQSDAPNDLGGSRQHLFRAIEDSLRRLQVDYIDLYQTHYSDHDTPFEETLGALDDLRRAGKIRYAGASNYRASELVEALWAADKLNVTGYVSLQPHYNLIQRDEYERELMHVCNRHGIGVIPFFPLASGFLTGKYAPDAAPETPRSTMVQRRYYNDRAWKILDAVRAVAEETGAAPGNVAIAWLMRRPAVTSPILGARTAEQVKDNLAAADVTLSPEQVQRLNEASAWEDVVTRPPGMPARPSLD